MSVTGQPINRSNFELPREVSREVIQKTQEASIIMRLARRVNLPANGLILPMFTGDPTPEWVTETNKKPVDFPTFGQKLMQAHKLAVIVPFSDEFKRDRRTLYDICIQRLPKALAEKFDATALFGPEGGTLANFDNLGSVTTQQLDAVSKTAYDGLVAADIDISEQGGTIDGYVFSPQGRGILLTAQDTNKRPLFINSFADDAIPRLLGAPTYFTKKAYKANAGGGSEGSEGTGDSAPDIVGFAGDWNHAMWGTIEGVKIDISNQATLTYTDENQQTVTINLWQQNMFAVRAEIEVGFIAETEYFNALTRAHSA